MKKSKLKLDDLKVNSFVTEVPKESQNTAQGGGRAVILNSVLCPFQSVAFVCEIKDPLYTWDAECPATAGNTAC
ncbi:pinensin family lanthipeptide [Fulvivirga sp. 29W222]|uniref:Pinensin family lanthipeptide n=1 Tax=Fulvivirga marina TaxID=2494733 RepID=A0A937FXK1_9BACT|nr:pinensin family lanthipeptide [Fulvivirga marina]MBL6447969.1 pinensin family lanthipeptide [Fulvivirga marina]